MRRRSWEQVVVDARYAPTTLFGGLVLRRTSQPRLLEMKMHILGSHPPEIKGMKLAEYEKSVAVPQIKRVS